MHLFDISISCVYIWKVMHKMMYKNHVPHLHVRDGVYYFVRRIPIDVGQYYASNRNSFSLKTMGNERLHPISRSVSMGL